MTARLTTELRRARAEGLGCFGLDAVAMADILEYLEMTARVHGVYPIPDPRILGKAALGAGLQRHRVQSRKSNNGAVSGRVLYRVRPHNKTADELYAELVRFRRTGSPDPRSSPDFGADGPPIWY